MTSTSISIVIAFIVLVHHHKFRGGGGFARRDALMPPKCFLREDSGTTTKRKKLTGEASNHIDAGSAVVYDHTANICYHFLCSASLSCSQYFKLYGCHKSVSLVGFNNFPDDIN